MCSMRERRGSSAYAGYVQTHPASHAELDNAPELDIGNPLELGAKYGDLRRRFPQINVLGGCCGTDHRHVECISTACRGVAQAA